MLIDVHAHFFPERSARADWREYNASRLSAGERIGITVHLNSVLGTFGRTSPTYFPSPADVTYGNDWALDLQREQPGRVRTYVCVNPNYPDHALAEIELARAAGAVGVERLLWGTDMTMETGWAKLRYLERLLPPEQLELIRWKNAARIFPRGSFPD